jgi:hypothetical protein
MAPTCGFFLVALRILSHNPAATVPAAVCRPTHCGRWDRTIQAHPSGKTADPVYIRIPFRDRKVTGKGLFLK